MSKKELKRAFTDTLPVFAGYIVLGIGFGIIMKSAGFGLPASFSMAAFIYAGSMQYLAVVLLTSGASYVTLALTTLMVNARHLFYGISMIDKFRDTGKIKPYLIFALTDETYSLVCADRTDIPENERVRYYFLVSLLDHVYWISGCVLGSLAGAFISFDTTGIDFALTALFITVFTDNWLKTDKHAPAVTGAAASVVCLVIFGADNFLIPAMAIITLSLLAERKLAKGDETA